MDMKTKLGLAALAMLAFAAMTPMASATEVATTEPLLRMEEEQTRYAPTPPLKVEACAAVIPPLCGPGGNDAARVAYEVLGEADCLAIQAGGGLYNC